MIILDHIKMFENKIYKMNPERNLLPATLDILTSTFSLHPRNFTLDPRQKVTLGNRDKR